MSFQVGFRLCHVMRDVTRWLGFSKEPKGTEHPVPTDLQWILAKKAGYNLAPKAVRLWISLPPERAGSAYTMNDMTQLSAVARVWTHWPGPSLLAPCDHAPKIPAWNPVIYPPVKWQPLLLSSKVCTAFCPSYFYKPSADLWHYPELNYYVIFDWLTPAFFLYHYMSIHVLMTLLHPFHT